MGTAVAIGGIHDRYGNAICFQRHRFLLDAGQYELFFNKDIGYDVKLTNMALFLHYLAAPLSLILLLAVPSLQGFSAAAYLSPLKTFFLYSMVFMEAINIHDFMRHLRTTGSLWQAMHRTTKDIHSAFPYYVSMISSFFKGVVLSALDLYSFILSQKRRASGPAVAPATFCGKTRMLSLSGKTKGGTVQNLLAKGKLPLDGLISRGNFRLGLWRPDQ